MTDRVINALRKEALNPVLKKAVKGGLLLPKSPFSFKRVPKWANPEEQVKYALKDPVVRRYLNPTLLQNRAKPNVWRSQHEHPDFFDVGLVFKGNSPYDINMYPLVKNRGPHIHQATDGGPFFGIVDMSGNDLSARTPEALGHELFHPLVSRVNQARGISESEPVKPWQDAWRAHDNILDYKRNLDARIAEERSSTAGAMRIMKALGAPLDVRKQMLRKLKGALRTYERNRRSSLVRYAFLNEFPFMWHGLFSGNGKFNPKAATELVNIETFNNPVLRKRMLEILYDQSMTGVNPEVMDRFLRRFKYRTNRDIGPAWQIWKKRLK